MNSSISKQLLLPIVSGISLTLLGYLIFSKNKPSTQLKKLQKQNESQDDQQIIKQQFQQLQKSRQILIALSNKIKINYIEDGILTKRSLFLFCSQSASTITQKQVKQIYQINRKSRRKHFSKIQNDIQQAQSYFKCVCIFDNDIQFLIQKSQKDLAVFLNLEYSIIGDTIDYYLKKQQNSFRNEISEFSVELRESIKYKSNNFRKKIRSTHQQIQYDIIKNVIQYQIDTVKNQKKIILQIIKKLQLQEQDQNFVPSFVYLYVFDKLYQKFGLQEEDVLQRSHELLVEEQGKILVSQWNNLQKNLMHSIADL